MKETGKIPPQAIDLEEAVLGAMLLERDAVEVVSGILTPACFYNDQNRLVYTSILRLKEKSKPVDILTVTQDLKAANQLEKAGGAYYVSQLTNRIASSVNTEFHARIIYQKFVSREIIKICHEAIDDAYDEATDCFELLDVVSSQVNQLSIGQSYGMKTHTVESLEVHLEERLKIIANSNGGLTGIDTGLHKINIKTGGWQNSDFNIIAARPGMGKTSLMLIMVIAAAKHLKKQNKYVKIFSKEMNSLQILCRLISQYADIPNDYFKNKPADDATYTSIMSCVHDLKKLNILIDDTPGTNHKYIERKINYHNKRGEVIGIIFDDYLQLGEPDKPSGNRANDVAQLSRGMKSVAKKFDIPVIELCQLNRQADNQDKPRLSNLKESGSIEQDADLVMFIYRPEYYLIPNIEYIEDGKSVQISSENKSELIFEKFRHGSPGSTIVGFNGSTTKFYDLIEDRPTVQPQTIEVFNSLSNNNDFLI